MQPSSQSGGPSQGSFRRVVIDVGLADVQEADDPIPDPPVRDFRAYFDDRADAAGANWRAAQVIAPVRSIFWNEQAHLVIPYLAALAAAVHNRQRRAVLARGVFRLDAHFVWRKRPLVVFDQPNFVSTGESQLARHEQSSSLIAPPSARHWR